MATGKHRGLLLGLGIWDVAGGGGRRRLGLGCMWVGGGYAAWNHESPTFQEPEGWPGTSPGSGLRGERLLGIIP